MVALTEFHTSDAFTKSPLHILCNWSGESIVGDKQLYILRRIFSNNQQQFFTLYYTPVTLQQVNGVTIDIRTQNDEPASFLKHPTFVTLHLKRYPFLRL